MDDTNVLVARLLAEAQSGRSDSALKRAEAALRAARDGIAGLHLVRYVAHNIVGDVARAATALDDMVVAADREQSPGWLACGLATRVSHTLRQVETDGTDFDLDGVLHDMVRAERVVEDELLPIPAVNARNAVALGYFDLRLYELAEPQFHAAYAISTDGSGSMWLSNLAEVHLYWALELYQVGQVEAAEAHTAEAERISVRAAAEATGPEGETWRLYALLLAACAKADRHDPAGAAEEIEHYLDQLAERGMLSSFLAYCRPFQAVALRRSGQIDKALAVMARAVAELPPDAGLLITSATLRTHTLLLATGGAAGGEAALRYGDTLAAALWQQRRRTLHSVTTLKSLESLQVRHDLAARAAEVDELTGIANRRAFDNAIRTMQRGTGTATVLLIDSDKFKQVNDTRGHAAGDAVLRAVADVLTAQVREGDLVARLGGDEFGALLTGIDVPTAMLIADRMVQAVRNLPDCPVTLSIGVAGGPARSLPEAVLRADEAMYRAKHAGGDSVEQAAALAAI